MNKPSAAKRQVVSEVAKGSAWIYTSAHAQLCSSSCRHYANKPKSGFPSGSGLKRSGIAVKFATQILELLQVTGCD